MGPRVGLRRGAPGAPGDGPAVSALAGFELIGEVAGGVDLAQGFEDGAGVDAEGARLSTEFPELPPMMSWVVTKSAGVFGSIFSFALTIAGGRSNGLLRASREGRTRFPVDPVG